MSAFNFQANNFPGFFIRHRNFLGELTKLNEGPINDFAFFLELRDPNRNDLVAFSSTNFLGSYLRHSNFRIRLDAKPDTNNNAELLLFLEDSTFVQVPGLANREGLSFRSVNFPDRFLRHRDFHLFVESDNSPSFAQDATFLMKNAAVNIDPGTVLVPADG